MKYFSTFITGFGSVVEATLKSNLKEVNIELLLDGLIVYSTNSLIEDVIKLRFLNNTFLLTNFFDKEQKYSIEQMIKVVLSEELKLPRNLVSNWKTFRIITSLENKLIPVNNNLLLSLEEYISENYGLKVNRSNPQMELWFILRSEGYGFFGARLTKHRDYGKTLQKGELRPEFANILCLLSNPKSSDTFLDPFCGSGSISIELAKSFPFNKILAGDNDKTKVLDLDKKVKAIKIDITVFQIDALKLAGIEDNSIDKIITDPPWGYFGNQKLNLNVFYKGMLNSFYRVLKKDGLVVLLIGERELLENLLSSFKDKFRLGNKFYTLISGKKAGAYVLTRL